MRGAEVAARPGGSGATRGSASCPAHCAADRICGVTAREVGPDYSIPYFDPLDGGTLATLLYLLEAPGPRAVASGFVSRDNPDETAKSFLLLNQEAGIDRRRTVVWNIVPWYLGDGGRIRAAEVGDTTAGAGSLERLFGLLPRDRCVAADPRDSGARHRPGEIRLSMDAGWDVGAAVWKVG